MYLIAPIVMLLAISGALYKTQEVWSMDQYNLFKVNPSLQAFAARTRYLKALEEGESKVSASGGASPGY